MTTKRFFRQAGGCMGALAVALAGFAADATKAPKDNSVALPKMTVGADVPLRKIAEHTMLEPRFAPAAVATGDFLYLIGGLRADNDGLTSIERFNVRTGKTEKFADLRIARFWHSAVLAGEKIYVLGGMAAGVTSAGHGRTGHEPSVEIVDLATRTVTRGPDMPDARRSFGCVQLGGKIHVFGGQRVHRDQVAETNTVLVLDLASQKWSDGVPMPAPREAGAVAVDGGFIVVPGGYVRAKGALDVVDVFDPKEGVWRSLPPLARRMSAHSLVFFGRHLFLFGNYQTPQELVAYDLRTKKSEVFTLGYRASRHAAAVAHEGKIYVVGGREDRDSVALNLIQVFEPTRPAAK